MSEATPKRTALLRRAFCAGTALAASAGLLAGPAPARAADQGPIKIGVISEESALVGATIPKAAQLAADEINAAGGVNGRKIQIVTYDDHNSAADAVRAFQRAVQQDHVNAVIASYVSEVALAIEPWAARLHEVWMSPGAASNEISAAVHKNYAQNKYTFHMWMTSAFIAQSICDYSHDLLAPMGMKSVVVMSEDAAWTTPLDQRYLECLPKAGFKVLDHIRFSPDTTDFTPIYNKIEGEHPDVIMAGISHVGVQPTVQWAQQQVPIPMAGQSSQATTSTFWKDTNGAANGVITATAAAPGDAITPKTIPFMTNYEKRYGATPAYAAFSTYDGVYVLANAIKEVGTDPDKMVDALEKTHYEGTLGTIGFYGKDSPFTHALKYGPDWVSGVAIQWQDGKQVTLWPQKVANGKLKFPSFIKINQAAK